MFTSPLKRAAEDYLRTNDSAPRDAARGQLLRAGESAVAPLLDALVAHLRSLSSMSLGKKEMNHFIDELGRQGVFDESHLNVLRQHAKGVPDRENGGMSRAQWIASQEACNRAWGVISELGEPGRRSLFDVLNGRDKRLRLAALLALCCEKNPSQLLVNSLMASAPFQDISSSDTDVVAGELVVRIMVAGGNQRAREMLEQSGQRYGLSGSDFADGMYHQAFVLLAK